MARPSANTAFGFALVLIVTVSCARNIAAVNWGSISDPAQLAAISADLFSNFTASDAGSMQPQACPGFQNEQVIAIPPDAFGGFKMTCMSYLNATTASVMTPQQMQNLNTDFAGACSGLSALWVMNLTRAALQAWSKPCISQTVFMWSHLAASFFERAPDNVFTSLGEDQVKNIAPNAFARFSNSQIALLTKSGCRGITFDQFDATPAQLFGSFSSDCVSGMSSFLWGHATFAQFSNTAAAAVAGMDSYAWQYLSDDGYRAMTPDKLAMAMCGSMKSSGPPLMPVETWAHMIPSCVSKMDSSSFYSLDASRLAVLSSEVCAALDVYELGALNGTAVYALSDDCIRQFKSCSQIRSSFLAGLRPESFGALTGDCASNSPGQAWSKINADQLSHLNVDACGKIGSNVASIPDFAFSGLTLECFASWPPPNNFGVSSCGSLSGKSVEYLNSSFFSVITTDCLNALSRHLVPYISPEQAVLIPPAVSNTWKNIHLLSYGATLALTTEQVATLPEQEITRFGALQLSALVIHNGQDIIRAWGTMPLHFTLQIIQDFKKLVTDAPSSYAAAFMEFPSSDLFSTVSWLRILFSNATESSYNEQLWQTMPPLTLSGIPSWHTKYISVALWANTSKIASTNLLADTVSTMTPEQFTALSPAAIGELPKDTWTAVSPSSIALMSTEQVAKMSPSAFSVMVCYQLDAFSPAKIANASEDIRKYYESYHRPCPAITPQIAEAPVEDQPIAPAAPTDGAFKIALIVVSVVLAVTVIGFIVAWVITRNNRRTAYEPLQ